MFKTLKEALIIRYGVKTNIHKKARELLVSMGLESDIFDRYPHSLSGGQRQRVGIARAMAMEPKLIVADEPTEELDRESADEILDLLEDLSTKQKKTIVMVTHDPKAADRANRCLALEKGSLVIS